MAKGRVYLLRSGTYFNGLLSSGPTSSPGDIDPQRLEAGHPIQTIEQVLNSLICLGREILKREEMCAFSLMCLDFVDDLHVVIAAKKEGS